MGGGDFKIKKGRGKSFLDEEKKYFPHQGGRGKIIELHYMNIYENVETRHAIHIPHKLPI